MRSRENIKAIMGWHVHSSFVLIHKEQMKRTGKKLALLVVWICSIHLPYVRKVAIRRTITAAAATRSCNVLTDSILSGQTKPFQRLRIDGIC